MPVTISVQACNPCQLGCTQTHVRKPHKACQPLWRVRIASPIARARQPNPQHVRVHPVGSNSVGLLGGGTTNQQPITPCPNTQHAQQAVLQMGAILHQPLCHCLLYTTLIQHTTQNRPQNKSQRRMQSNPKHPATSSNPTVCHEG